MVKNMEKNDLDKINERLDNLEHDYSKLILIELNNIGDRIGRSDIKIDEIIKEINSFIRDSDELSRRKSTLYALNLGKEITARSRDLFSEIKARDNDIKEMANRSVLKVRSLR